jgi:hypothetical protein
MTNCKQAHSSQKQGKIMSTLHAVRRERQGLRIVQAKKVMPMVGPLLDAWEGTPNDLKADIREAAPELAMTLEAIADIMENAPLAEETD